MVKLIAPLLSLNAKGNIGGLINYAKKGNVNYARKLKKAIAPLDKKTNIQLLNREYFRNIVVIWQNLEEQERDYLDIYAEYFNLSGFNLFTKSYILEYPTELGMTILGKSEIGELIFD